MSDTEQSGTTEGTESEVQETEQQESEATETEQSKTEEEAKATSKEDELPEWARKELSRVRDEAASRRTQLREAQEALAKAKSPEDIEAATKDLTDKVNILERTILVNDVARAHELPAELAARLKGDTKEELEADAKLLAKFANDVSDPENLSGGLTPDRSGNEPFDAVAESRKARANRY